MQVALHNNVKVYNLTAGKSLPEWLAAKKNKRKPGATFSASDERRVELIHDFEFPDFARTIFRTANGTYLFAAGDYPPRLKCFDANDMSVKFSFNADMPIMSGVSLSPDFRKFALRGEGRTITIHNCGNIIERLRVPHTQRCLSFHPHSAELLSGGTGHEIFRISLETGCFVESFKTNSDDGVNAVELFGDHGLILSACENGTVEAFDPRQAAPASVLSIAGRHDVERGSSMTALACDQNGLTMAVGTNKGQVALYDIRLNRPTLVKDHMTGLPIVKVAMYSSRLHEDTHVLSADTNCLRIWTKADGKNFTTIDAPAPIHDFVALRSQHNLAPPYASVDSGVIALCCDTPKIQVHFIPQLGAAPRWAGFLDAITEEMQETDTSVVYDDYKFILQAEADTLGLSSATITDGRVRPAMHGCYVENGLYRELKAALNPQGFNAMVEENKKAKKQEKLDERISKYHRAEPAPSAADAPLRSGMSAVSARTTKGAPADPINAMMRGLTPQAIELLSRDPRFAAKMGLEGFTINKNHPDYIKLFQKVQEQQLKATERRAKYDSQQFRVVTDTGADAADDSVAAARPATGSSDEARAVLRGATKRTRAEALSLAADDGVVMMEAKDGAPAVGATERQAHESRKLNRLKGLTLAERLAKASKENGARR